jgi:hypothetical protein
VSDSTVPFPLPDNNLKNLISALILLHLPFKKPMPITYFEGIKSRCNFTGTQSLVLQGKGRWVMISDNGLGLSHRTTPTSTF